MKKLASHPEFIAGNVETGFIAKHKETLLPPAVAASPTVLSLSALTVLLQEANAQTSVNSKSNGKNFTPPWENFF